MKKKDNSTGHFYKIAYIPRIFAVYFCIVILLTSSYSNMNTVKMIIALFGIMWPHLAYLQSKTSLLNKNHDRAEQYNNIIDGFICGVLIYELSLSLLPLLVITGINLTNSLLAGGLSLMTRVMMSYLTGFILMVSLFGLQYNFQTDLTTSIICIIVFLAYTGIFSFWNYRQLLSIKRNQKKLMNFRKKINTELGFARSLQQGLIPPEAPKLKNTEIAYTYIPVEAVGGDFFDFFLLEEGSSLGIFICDVSGHGVAAALITSMVKTVILQSGHRKEQPAELLSYINRTLHGQTGQNFITAFYGIYRPDNRSLVYCNAGHNPPYIIRNENVEELEVGRSAPLSIWDKSVLEKKNLQYRERQILLPARSKVLLHTDGFTEVRNSQDGSMFLEILPAILQNHAQKSSVDFTDSLIDELEDFRGKKKLDDDICLICLDLK
jgi:serine phosphatase RsbU (regulator of sigma subunit)